MGLELFIVGMWAMVLAVSAFLVLVVANIDVGGAPRLLGSAIQAVLAVSAVVLLAFGLSRLKRVYASKKLK